MLVRKIDLRRTRGERARHLLQQEWLVTNGLGGYASGTICGRESRRYHGLLIAALPAPFGRQIMLNHLSEFIRLPDRTRLQFGGEEPDLSEETNDAGHFLTEFRLENGLPVWRYQIGDVLLEKHVVFVYGQNTVHIHYRLLSDHEYVQLELEPAVHFRGHDNSVAHGSIEGYVLKIQGDQFEVCAPDFLPTLRLVARGLEPTFTYGGFRREMFYQKEADRGYTARGALWSPGSFCLRLQPQKDATLIASTEWRSNMLALSPHEAVGFFLDRHQRLINLAAPDQDSPAADLVLAADQFIITPAGRLQDAARAHAAGDEVRTIIAGYPWFTDWGRDTMISLEGLTLTTRRWAEAGWILRTFAYYIRDGLLPNLFPEGQNQGLYHTADATLWFFHALDRYVEITGDRDTLRLVLPRLIDVYHHHNHGTRFGIGVDPRDQLLKQGAPGFQLTWMDAKVEDWVVTPRRGKTVEINGLWYNALRLLEDWVREEHGPEAARPIADQARRTAEAFNQRFWYPQGKYLYDVVDGEQGNDPSLRPNQLLAFSLKHPVLDQRYWEPVLNIVKERLLTPIGLRTLGPGHPDYKPKYFGDLRARDAAYHQGTVWAWLIGPFIDCWLKLYPDDKAGARKFLAGFEAHLNEGCVGSISEIFDAEPPFVPRGCFAQAWSIAEVLRAFVKTAPPAKSKVPAKQSEPGAAKNSHARQQRNRKMAERL